MTRLPTRSSVKPAPAGPTTFQLIFGKRSQRAREATGTQRADDRKPQVVGLWTPVERRVRKPMLYPLSYGGASA